MTFSLPSFLRALRWMVPLVIVLGFARPAQAACYHSACVQVSGQLASIDTQRSILLNALFGQMLGTSVSLTVGNWQHLADSEINLLSFLQALQTRLTLGTPEEALNADASILTVLRAAVDVMQVQENMAAVSALNALIAANPSGVIRLADLLHICVQCSNYADIRLNLLDLVTGSAQLFNYKNVLVTPTPVGISDAALLTALGLGGSVSTINLSAQILEPPVIVCGMAGAQFYGAAIRLKVHLVLANIGLDVSSLVPLLPGGVAGLSVTLTDLSIYAAVARASGVIGTVDGLAGIVQGQAAPGVADLFIGNIPDGVFFNRSTGISSGNLGFGTLGRLSLTVLGVQVNVGLRVKAFARGQTSNQSLFFSGPFPKSQTIGTHSTFVSALLNDLLTSLQLELNVPNLPLVNDLLDLALGAIKSALTGLVRNAIITPILTPVLGGVVDPLLAVLGIRLGEAHITARGAYVHCDATISGRVYRDGNRNGMRDADEAGTEFDWRAKLVPAATPAGPAIQVVPVNPSTGLYTFTGVSPGIYRIVIDDNETLTDVTPVPMPAGWMGTEFPGLVRPEVVVALVSVPNQNFGLAPFNGIAGVVFRDSGTGAGGVANDGIRNGGEVGLGGTELRLLGPGDVVIDRTRSDAAGLYGLALPNTIASGTVLRIVATPPLDRIATGASVGGTAGTYDRATGTLTFTSTGSAGYAGVNFGEVQRARLHTDGQQSIVAGSTALFSHRYQPGTTGSVQFTISATAHPAAEGWSSLVYLDTNGNGQIDAGEPQITGSVPVTGESDLALLVKVFAPVTAPFGSVYQTSITATLSMTNASPALAQAATRLDLTTIGDAGSAGLVMMKNVDKPQAFPGDTLVYVITYFNSVSEPLQNVVIRDSTPTFTRFLSASAPLTPPQLGAVTITAPPVGQKGDLRWEYSGTLPPAARGTITFSVTIDPLDY